MSGALNEIDARQRAADDKRKEEAERPRTEIGSGSAVLQ
jgi:hypothetical protein